VKGQNVVIRHEELKALVDSEAVETIIFESPFESDDDDNSLRWYNIKKVHLFFNQNLNIKYKITADYQKKGTHAKKDDMLLHFYGFSYMSNNYRR